MIKLAVATHRWNVFVPAWAEAVERMRCDGLFAVLKVAAIRSDLSSGVKLAFATE
jgi:hypothetical protein